MTSDQSDVMSQAWKLRYTAASAALDDSAHLIDISRRIQALSRRPEAAADFFGDQKAIAGGGCVGLFAGTFNPLTRAHIALIDAAESVAKVDRLLWILAVASIDKETLERATLVDRLAQLLAYVTAQPHNAVVLVNRGLYVEELALVRPYLSTRTELVVLVGYDKIVQILDPHYYRDRNLALDELFREARFVVAPRGHATRAELDALLSQPENRRYSTDVSYLPVASAYRDDSATAARQLVAQPGITASVLSHLLPPEAVALALQTDAYSSPTDITSDKYHWRSAWIAALTSAPAESIAHLPGMKILCEAAMDPGELGQNIRSSLLVNLANQEESQHLLSLLRGM